MLEQKKGWPFALVSITLAGLALFPVTASAHDDRDREDVFTVAVIPDTQNYVDNNKAQPASLVGFKTETQYLANNRHRLNLAFVTHVGDVVQHGDGTNGSPGDATYGAGAEWARAKEAIDLLAVSGVPFSLTPGNHDYDNYSYTAANGYQPLKSNVMWKASFGSTSPFFAGKRWYGGASDGLAHSPGLSSYQTFRAGGETFLHIALEMEAGDAALAWAQGVIDAHHGSPTIITTHEYLDPPADADDSLPLAVPAHRIPASARYLKNAPGGWNDAQGVWEKLIATNDQIFMVLCGHAWGSTVNQVSKSENLRIDKNNAGHTVYQLLTDYQGNTSQGAGGDGWLRLMKFDLREGTIHFSTYSPTLDAYAGRNGERAFNQAPEFSDFVLPMPVQVRHPSHDRAMPWSFGVIADTQWTEADDGRNPGTSAIDIISQVNHQFIERGVDLVVAVGDLADKSSAANMDIRARYTQALYDAHIGFFPLRGNHDSGAGPEFLRVFPQTQTGWNNSTPRDALAVVNPDAATMPPAPVVGAPFLVGSSFSSPASMAGKTYSFDHQNVRFVLLDQFDGAKNTIQAQQGWISQTLASRPAGTHALVFGHKGLITENHVDTLFGSSPSADPAGTDAFIKSLSESSVRYYLGGHDHMHDRSLVWTTDGSTTRVTQLVCASDSSKFYFPNVPSNDEKYDVAAFGHPRQTPLAQELNTVGYYIFTVDGPRVTGDYYSAVVNPTLAGGESLISTTPTLHFTKRETFGSSLNGKEFVVAQGRPYTVVQDAFEGTKARILEGVNGSVEKDGSGRPMSHAVDTGWSPRSGGAASSTLHLWGMATEMGSDETDVYVLSLSYEHEGRRDGAFGLSAADSRGHWVNAVDLDIGGRKKFVSGPWRTGYHLGTYGVDERTQTAWAVVNHDGAFRVGHLDSDDRR